MAIFRNHSSLLPPRRELDRASDMAMRTLKECHEVIMRHIGQPANVVKPLIGDAAKIMECLNSDGLTGWEIEFLSSALRDLGMEWDLTAAQLKKLDEIWRERT